jgi:hypothetical protein
MAFILKGTVARDLRHLGSRESTPYGLQIHILNYFPIRFRLWEDIQRSTFISVVRDSTEPKKLLSVSDVTS